MTFHSIERLGSPFAAVAELGFAIPPDGDVVVDNREQKLVFFLQADCAQEIDGVGAFGVQTGDVLVVPRVCVQRYRLRTPRSSSKVHALKISFALPALTIGLRAPAVDDPEESLTA